MIDRKIRLSFLIFGIIVYSVGFMAFTYQQMPDYFNKDLMSYDECTNAVVSNNLYRDFFPPRLRLNPLDENYAGWKEGPDWQHIPPLSFYVPYPFYKLDGHASIEVRRLSYVFIAYLQGLIFIILISALFKQKRAISTAILATWLWLLSPFVRHTLNANAFGYSDIVLSFTVVLSIMMTLYYAYHRFAGPIKKEKFLYATIVAATLPIMVKNALGGLPILFLVAYLVQEKRKEDIGPKNLIAGILIPIAICVIYFGASLWKSPEAFRAEFLISFAHFGNYEGWAKPFHYYLTNYLPVRYLGIMFWPFVAGFLYSVYLWRKGNDKRKKRLTGVFLIYFLVVFVIISIVTSKSANFLLQGYLFILFFVLYMIMDKMAHSMAGMKFNNIIQWMYSIRLQVSIVCGVVFGMMIYLNVSTIYEFRNETYMYMTPKHHFFEFSELCDEYLYADQNTLFILDTDTLQYDESNVHEDPDFWMRYYILFSSGSEARRLEEVAEYNETNNLKATLARRYVNIYLVCSRETAENRYADKKGKLQALGRYYILPLKRGQVKDFL